MRLRVHRKRPEPWAVRRRAIQRTWTVPFWAFEWFWEWVAFVLSNWSFLEVLEYLGSFSILIAVIFYFSESGDRLKQKHYQAWQVVNTAQGKGGSGGRIEALQELNTDGVPLVGVDVSGAFLQGIHLRRARLLRSNFSSADLRDSDFSSADFSDADLRAANLRQCNLQNAGFQRANLEEADLWGADLAGADFTAARLLGADLRNANLANLRWRDVQNLKSANIFGVKNAPDGFVSWALKHGAVQVEFDAQ
jgi:Pentapeptide repeats (8 copies)